MQLDPSILALLAFGGVLAGFWGQVKTFMLHISSTIIVRADVDDPLKHVLRTFLYAHYQRLPSNKIIYRSKLFTFRGNAVQLRVPFKMPDVELSIYRRGWSVIFLTHNVLKGLRGNVDFDTLIKDALSYSVQLSAAPKTSVVSRYYVNTHYGAEKGIGAFASAMAKKSNSISEDSSSSAPSASYDIDIDTSVHRSFMYEPKEYLHDSCVSPFENLYYDDEVHVRIEEARLWLRRSDWYEKLGIPHRRGWLIEGGPGTGKTSLAKAVGQDLGLPIHRFYLSTLSDQEFIREWDYVQAPCIVLFEDFDNVFNKREPLTEHKSLTFDCVLNQISGIDTMSGIFLMITTNHIEKIDDALGVSVNASGMSTRPGRIDAVVRVGNINAVNKERMAYKMLAPWPDAIARVLASTDGYSPAQVQEACVQEAFAKMRDPAVLAALPAV